MRGGELAIHGNDSRRITRTAATVTFCEVSARCYLNSRTKASALLVFARLQLGDGGHDFIGHLLVNLFQPRLRTSLRFFPQFAKQHRLAVLHHDAFWFLEPHVASISLERSEDSHRHDGSIRLDHGESKSRAGGLELAVARARAFGKENDHST